MVPAGPGSIWDRTSPLTPLPIPIDPVAAAMAASFFTHEDDDASHPFLGLESASAVDGVWSDGDAVWLSDLVPHAAALPSTDEAHRCRRRTATMTEEVTQEDKPILHQCQSVTQNSWVGRDSASSRIESSHAAIADDAWIDPTHPSHTAHIAPRMNAHSHVGISPSSHFHHSLFYSSLPSLAAPSSSPLHVGVVPSSLPAAVSILGGAAAAAELDSKRAQGTRGCIIYHELEADGSRPCGRCAHVGRLCVDQSWETSEQQRRAKRPVEATMTSTSNASRTEPPQSVVAATAGVKSVSPQFDGLSAADLDQLSYDLSSRSCLAVALQMDFRDRILRTHAQVTAMKPPLSTLVEWHTQCASSLLHLADIMTVADFETLLTGGLTEEELNSSNWLSSPLAPWAKLSTRPLHFTFQPNTLALESHLAGVGAPPLDAAAAASHEDAESTSDPEFRLEWMPDTHIAFQHWRSALEARLRYEQHRQETRDRILAGTDETTAAGSLDLHANTPSDDDTSHLTDRFMTLGIGRSLSMPPPPPTHHDRVYSVHALWCPLGGPAENVARERERDAAKVKRTSSMQHVRSREIDDPYATPSSAAECCCKNSLPLPMRVTVNRSFERIFGWRRIDVELGVQREGLKWKRRWVRMKETTGGAFDQRAGTMCLCVCRALRVQACTSVPTLSLISFLPSRLLSPSSASHLHRSGL